MWVASMAFDKLKISTMEDVEKRAQKDLCSEEVATGAIKQELQALVEAGEEAMASLPDSMRL